MELAKEKLKELIDAVVNQKNDEAEQVFHTFLQQKHQELSKVPKTDDKKE